MKLPVTENFIINEDTLPVITQLAESIPGGFFIYHAHGDQELIYFNSHLPAIFGCADSEEFRTLTGNSFKGIVHPDDYAKSESTIKEQIDNGGNSIDHVKYRFIRKDGSIGMMDDYGHFSHSESFGDIYYVFVQDITKEYLDEQKAMQMEILNDSLADYEGVFLLDCVNDTRKTFHDRLAGAAAYDDAVNYSVLFAKYVENCVCKPDREKMKNFIDPANIPKLMGSRKEMSVTYRDKTSGTQRFYEMRLIRFSDTEVLQSFRENDAETVNRLLFGKLKENYFAILSIDLETGNLRSYKEDPLNVVGKEGSVSSLSTVMLKLASYFEGETKSFFETFSKTENIRKKFAKEDQASYRCRSVNGEGTRWVNVMGTVLARNADKEPSLFCLTFNYLDEKAAEVQDMQEKLKQALDETSKANATIAEQQLQAGKAEQARKEQIAKIAGTESTYIVNPGTERFQILGQNEYLSERYTAEEDFNTSISRYIASDVFEQDRNMVKDAISIRAMKEHLDRNDEYIIRYRDISKGVPRWYEMKAVRLSDTEILYSFSDKDEEIISQMMTEKFREMYFGLYYVNLDSGLAQIVKTGHPEITGETGKYVQYSELMKNIAGNSYGQSSEFFSKISDIDYIRKRFADEDFAYHVYKSYIFEGSRWVNYTGRILQRHNDGTPAIFALALSLLDEETAAKEEAKLKLEDALNKAESASRAKTDFLFNMSHDIRTPMNAILGFTGMAQKYLGSTEKVADYLEKIDSSSKQLLELINQVLEMSRIESGKLVLEESPVNVMQQFNDAITVLSEQAKEKGLEFHYSLCDAVHVNVFADTAKLSSITMNITGNAIKYTPAGGRIDFTLRETSQRKPGFATYIFTVADTGIGMSADFLKTIYEPFTREQTSTVSRIQGTGLGMSIVKDFVDFLGGDIRVCSEPGKGTRFDITVDLRINEEADNKTEEKQMMQNVSFDGRKILLVEDNELNRDIATDILEDEGFDVQAASDGSAAVEIMKEKGPDCFDVILMDIQMPVMNGYEATKAIRSMYPTAGIPIIALSANAFEEDRMASLSAGMNSHVAKPINVKELKEEIAKYL